MISIYVTCSLSAFSALSFRTTSPCWPILASRSAPGAAGALAAGAASGFQSDPVSLWDEMNLRKNCEGILVYVSYMFINFLSIQYVCTMYIYLPIQTTILIISSQWFGSGWIFDGSATLVLVLPYNLLWGRVTVYISQIFINIYLMYTLSLNIYIHYQAIVSVSDPDPQHWGSGSTLYFALRSRRTLTSAVTASFEALAAFNSRTLSPWAVETYEW